jgi:hypothetical protein
MLTTSAQPRGGGEEVGEGGMCGVDQPLEVEVDHPVPLLGGGVLDRPEQHLAGVVDDDVEAAQLVDGAVDGGDCLLLVGDVGLDRQGGVTVTTDLAGQTLEAFQSAGRDGDLGALGGQCSRGRLADAAAGARD